MSLAIVFLFINSAIKPILRKVENAKGNGKLNNYYQIPFVIPNLLFVKDRSMYPNNLLDLNKTNLYGIKKMLDAGLRYDDDLRIVHGTNAGDCLAFLWVRRGRRALCKTETDQ